jgi:DNA-binding NarL/FixJ family response regulator
MLIRLEETRDRLASTVDDLVEALAVFDVEGCEIYRSQQLRALLAADPQREALVERMQHLASSFSRLRTTRGADPLSGPAATEELQTQVARHVLRASYMGRGIFGLDEAVVICVDRLTPALPSPESLMERYGLTPRQVEVALLMARGLSDREIATLLEISWHTVRRHTEWVLSKIGVHSRNALALGLLE